MYCKNLLTALLLLLYQVGFGQQYAITHVNIIPMYTQGIQLDMTVLIENGKIRSVEPASSAEIPQQFQVIDASGKYMIPGLFDMHAHFFYEQGENKNTCEKELKMMLANGLTTVRIECGDPLYGYYRYNKMTPEEKNALLEKGKKIFNENLGPLGDMFKPKNGSTANSANTTM